MSPILLTTLLLSITPYSSPTALPIFAHDDGLDVNTLFSDDPFPTLWREDVISRSFDDDVKQIRDTPIIFPGLAGFRRKRSAEPTLWREQVIGQSFSDDVRQIRDKPIFFPGLEFRKKRNAVENAKKEEELANVANLIAGFVGKVETVNPEAENEIPIFETQPTEKEDPKFETPVFISSQFKAFDKKSKQKLEDEIKSENREEHKTIPHQVPVVARKSLRKQTILDNIPNLQRDILDRIDQSAKESKTRNSRHNFSPVFNTGNVGYNAGITTTGSKHILSNAKISSNNYLHNIDKKVKQPAPQPIFHTNHKGANIVQSSAPTYIPGSSKPKAIVTKKPELYKPEEAFQEYIPPNEEKHKDLFDLRKERQHKKKQENAYDYVSKAIKQVVDNYNEEKKNGKFFKGPVYKSHKKPATTALINKGVKTIGIPEPAKDLERVFDVETHPHGLGGFFNDWRVTCNKEGYSRKRWITAIYDNNDNFQHLDKIRCSASDEKLELDLYDNEVIDTRLTKCPHDYVLTGLRKTFNGFFHANEGKCTKLIKGSIDEKRCDAYSTAGKDGGPYGIESKWRVQCPPRWAAVGVKQIGDHISSLLCCAMKPEVRYNFSELRLP